MKRMIYVVVCAVLAMALLVSCAAEAPVAEATASPAETEAATAEEPAAPVVDETMDEPAEVTPEAGETVKIGVSFYDLNNPTWAEFADWMTWYCDQQGIEITILGAEVNAPKQISQVENFVESGMDAIIIGAVDPASLDESTKKAKDNGIAIISILEPLTYADIDFLVPNHDIGVANGTAAANWINEKLDGTAKVGVLNLPELEIIVVREEGILSALAEQAPGAEVVATASAATAAEGMSAVETFLQANPDMEVICCIGDGGAMGASEAVKAAGLATEDFAIFSCDAVEEVCREIKDGGPIKTSISLGGGKWIGVSLIDFALDVINGESYEKENFMKALPVDASNVEEYAAENEYTLD